MNSSRILALFFPEFALQHLVRERPELQGGAIVIHAGGGGKARTCAMSDSALRAGIRVGWSLPQARARFPTLLCLPRDEAGEKRSMEAIAEALGWVSPRTVWKEGDCLLLNLGGTAHLHGGEEALARGVEASLQSQGVRARGAVADRPATAQAMAGHGGGDFTIVPPGEDRAALGGLPICALNEDARIVTALTAVGIHHLRAVAALGEHEMARRFGDAGVRIHQKSRGVWQEVLSWHRSQAPLRERMDLPDPCLALEGLAFALRSLLIRLEGRMQGRGVATVGWSLELEMDVGVPHVESFRLSCPQRGASVLLAMARHRLQHVRLPEPVVAIAVWTEGVQAFAGSQENLLDGTARGGEPLHALLGRLSAALGTEAVHSLQPADSHRPESAVSRRPFQPTDRSAGGGRPAGVRPTRLLQTPESLSFSSDGRGVFWRGRRRLIDHMGPVERLCGEWWDRPFQRDYHVLTLAEGGRWWIYRDGRLGEWRLHGFFE